MGNEPLLLAKKAEEMVLYGYQVLRHFPRSERHVLSVAPAWPTWPHAGYVVVEDRRVEVRRVSH